MEQDRWMNRRAYLATVAGLTTATAGCTSAISGLDEPQNNSLPAPDSRVDPADLPYPGYGQQLPDVTLPAPLHDETVSVRQFETDVFVTFFYSHCATVCPRLVSSLRNIRGKAEQEGHGDDVTFLAITFDPERDTADRLREYTEIMNLDQDAENWYFLRPESPSRAKAVVQEQFGVAFQRTTPEDMDMYMFNHLGLILLANDRNYVERTWTDKDPMWTDLYGAFGDLREREG